MTKRVTNGLDLQAQRIQNVGDPSVATDAANKAYVDNIARGLSWKAPARAASTGNVSLAAPGALLDGVMLAVNDRVLLKNQTAAAENGVYVWTGSGVALTRATDADTGAELNPGTALTVTEGAVNADKVFLLVSDAAVTIGTTATVWGQLGGGGQTYTGGNGINVSGAVISGVAKAGGGLVLDSSGFAIDTAVVARKIAGNMGNGSLTSISIAHGFGSKDVLVSVRLNATDEEVIADWVATDANTVTFSFPAPPASGAYRFAIQG